jgi:ribosomal protein S7
MSNSKISYAAQAVSMASDLIEAKKCEDKATSLREGVNKQIIGMHKDKVVIGRYSKDGTGCSIATAWVDKLVLGGLSKKTAQNYLSLLREAVKTGKPVKDWGGTKAGGRQAAAGAKGSAKGKKEFADKLATCFRDAEFEGFVNDLEASWDNDEIKSLLEGIKSYLEASGIEIK